MEDILYSGFLTKSPPEYKINRARWQRRWFVLKRNPKAVYLQYYKDQTSSRPKGTIDLNTCEQMDQGLTFETRRSLANAFIFSIVTPKRKYFLVSNTEEDMIAWVRQICLACGFQLDNQEGGGGNEPEVTQPINVTSQQPGSNHVPHQHPASVPALPSETADSYIPLNECVTGTGQGVSRSVPTNNGGPEEMLPAQEAAVGRGRSNTNSSGSDSSIPSLSAPLPPQAQRDSGVMDPYMYDVPPNLQRPGSGELQPLYDIPPVLASKEPLFRNQPAPSVARKATEPGPTDPSQFGAGDGTRENGDHDVYAVPAASRDSGGLYDFPPAHPLLRRQNQEMSSSTDKLAQDFQQISVRNSRGAADEGPQDIYSVPPPAVKATAADLFAPPDEELPRNLTPPPRPPKHNQPVATPPRPPKPQHLRPTPSPPLPSEEHYDLLPGQSGRVQSIYAVPPSSGNWTDLRSPPNGHKWLDNKVPTPDDVRYINTKKSASRQSMPPQSGGYSHQRHGPPPQQPRTSVLSDTATAADLRYSPGPGAQPESYLPMLGSGGTSGSGGGGGSGSGGAFQYPDMYMPMEGSGSPGPRHEAQLSGAEAEQEPYALMSGTSGFPASRQLPPNFHRQTFSGGQRPPPIDRSSKPDRKASEGSVRNSSNIGMAGSFYANSDDPIFRPLKDLRPIQSERTMSFSKRPGQYETIEVELDPFRGRSNTNDSTTSSSDEDLYGPEDNGLPRPVPPVPEEDAYIFKDSPSRHNEGALPDALSSAPIPASLPSQQKDDIEYLELSHDHHSEEPSQPPPRPPKPSSPKVEYIDLDLERMQALKQVTEKREEEKDGGVSGRGTLTRRDF